MASHSPSEHTYMVASGLTKLMVPSVSLEQSSGSNALTTLRLSLETDSSLLQEEMKVAAAAHRATRGSFLNFIEFLHFFVAKIDKTAGHGMLICWQRIGTASPATRSAATRSFMNAKLSTTAKRSVAGA